MRAERPRPRVLPACWHDLPPGARDAVRALAVDARQIEFAGTIETAIRVCEEGDPANVRGLALLVADRVAGFVVLKRGPAAPAWAAPEDAVVSGLRIDLSMQGRGIGTAALHALADWVRENWPDRVRFALRVDEDNIAAIRAYAKAGWVEVGERRIGRVGPERTLLLSLHQDAPGARPLPSARALGVNRP
jgi:RimJ/RimL family protein N-acetyltransferase